MNIDPAFLSPVFALLGAFLGAGASLMAAIYTHRGQYRLQRVAEEITKREGVYVDFVMYASNLLLRAYTRDDIELSGDEQHLIGLINRMRFFASSDVIGAAEAALRAILEISLKPRVELRQLATEALTKSLDPDPLLAFSLVCAADLASLQRSMV
jgi:hypothetical protein